MADGLLGRRVTAAAGGAGRAARAARGRATPFYLFDRDVARRNLRRLREAAGPDAELFYPWKCNRHPELRNLAEQAGFGAEVSAADDLVVSLRSHGSRVLYQGPVKPERCIDLALAAGAWLVADSAEDAGAILERAHARRIVPRYLLRFRPGAAQPTQRAFGLTPSRVRGFCARLAREGRPLPSGLAFHLGTRLFSPAPYVSAVREAGRLAASLRPYGVRVEVLDVGGGFPAGTPCAHLRAIRGAVRSAGLGAATLFLEPGRAVASDAFHLVTRVVRVTGRRVYVDASRMSHAFFAAWAPHDFHPVPRRPGRGTVEIAGPLPVGIDRFSNAEEIGRPREGDLLVIGSVGAYNLNVANTWAGRLPEVVAIGVSASRGARRSGGRTRR